MSSIGKAVCLAWLASSAFAGVPESAQKALALFEKAGTEWKVPCASCHHQSLAMMALDAARRHGVPVNELEARAHVTRTFKPFLTSVQGILSAPMDVFSMGYGAVAVRSAGLAPNLITSLLARRFANWQLPDGHWAANDGRPPMSASEFTATALAVRTLALYLPRQLQGERSERFARARKWLLNTPPRSNEDRTFQLLGLLWSGAPAGERKRAAEALLALQQKDGGWAQESGMESDAYATGQSLVALRQAGDLGPQAPAFERGIGFLLARQQPDGSWLVKTRLHSPAPISPPFFDSGFPNGPDQYISFAGSAWAAMALLESLPEQKHPVPPLPLDWAKPVDEKPWMETVLFGSVQELKSLLDGGADASELLPFAIPDAAKVKLLLERGAKPADDTILMAATYRNSAPVVRLLREHGAKVPPPAILMASMTGDTETAALLLACGASPRRPAQGESPLANAVMRSDAAMVRLLIDNGADVNETDDTGMTPLISAALQHKTSMVRLLLELGADRGVVDKFGYTALRHAGDIGHADPETARILEKTLSAR